MKKYLSFVLAVLLIVGALAGCGEQGNTPAPDNSSTPIRTQATLPADGSFASQEYEKLLALRFDGYEEMTVAEFRGKVGAVADTKEYTDLFEQLSKDTALQELKDTDEDAEFLFCILPQMRWKQTPYISRAFRKNWKGMGNSRSGVICIISFLILRFFSCPQK